MIKKQLFIILSFLLIIVSCKSKKIFTLKGVDVYERIELCSNGKFYRYISGVFGNDSIKGKWRKKGDTIFLKYDEKIFHIKDYDSLATIKEKYCPNNDSLIFKIKSNDNYNLFYIKINNTINCMTDTTGLARCKKVKINKIKIYRNLPYFYTVFSKNNEKSNYFEIKMHNPNTFLNFNNNKVLHIDPPNYFINKRNKLIVTKNNNKYFLLKSHNKNEHYNNCNK